MRKTRFAKIRKLIGKRLRAGSPSAPLTFPLLTAIRRPFNSPDELESTIPDALQRNRNLLRLFLSPHQTSETPLSPCTTETSQPVFHDFRNFALRVAGCNLALKCACAPSEPCLIAGEGRSPETCLKPPRKP